MDRPEPTTRKNVTLPDTLWAAIADYRFTQRIASEAEAIRRLIRAGIAAESGAPTRPRMAQVVRKGRV